TSPGIFHITGCGEGYEDDIAWITRQLVERNCIVYTAGCAASELARDFNPEKGNFIYEEFGAETNVRNLINLGGCASCTHLLAQGMKWPRIRQNISHYANFAETADSCLTHTAPVLILWGALSDRMYSVACAWARSGIAVVAGPASAFDWPRHLTGNKWDWASWWTYETDTGKKRIVEPAPRHLICPVETKEEALAIAPILLTRPAVNRERRFNTMETYLELFQEAFGSKPDDWHLYTRIEGELHRRYKASMLKELATVHGWEADRLSVTKHRHPDGRLMERDEFLKEYSALDTETTMLTRLIKKPLDWRKKED
ncbi:hypothetical protein ACFLX5_05960, partial [Chloroflexota bacterium]